MTTSLKPRIAAASLVLGPTLFTVADLFRRVVTPDGTVSDKHLSDAVGQHPGLWSAAAVLSVLSALALLPGVCGLLAGARGRGGRTTTVGVWIVAAGLVASTGHAVGFYGPFGRFADSGASAASIKAFLSAGGDPATNLCIGVFILGLVFGTLVLFIGLRRGRRVPVWAVVAAVVYVVSGSTGGVPAGIIGIAAALVAFTPVALRLLTEARDEAVPVGSEAHRVPDRLGLQESGHPRQ